MMGEQTQMCISSFISADSRLGQLQARVSGNQRTSGAPRQVLTIHTYIHTLTFQHTPYSIAITQMALLQSSVLAMIYTPIYIQHVITVKHTSLVYEVLYIMSV